MKKLERRFEIANEENEMHSLTRIQLRDVAKEKLIDFFTFKKKPEQKRHIALGQQGKPRPVALDLTNAKMHMLQKEYYGSDYYKDSFKKKINKRKLESLSSGDLEKALGKADVKREP